jgi:hypothetical protein
VNSILALLLGSCVLFAAPPAPPPVPLPPGYHGPVPAPPRPSPYPAGYVCHAAAVSIDAYGNIYKNGAKLGQGAESFQAACNGDVAWRDGFEHLYRNDVEIDGGSFVEAPYEIAFNTGDVIWGDSGSGLYKNGKKLGDALRVELNGMTGDVGWLDSSNVLYKNDRRLASDVSTFWFQDGRLRWTDLSGKTYSERG